MSDKSNQQISNLMDGELEMNASQFLLKRMASDDSLSSTWSSYHLIKSCMQKKISEPLIIDITDKVIQQLSHQKPELITDIPVTNKWLKPILGMGIAASVAFMSVSLLQNQQGVNIDSATEKLTSIAQENIAQPIKTNISANVATASSTIVPPPSLSRFPSISTQESIDYNQGFSRNMNIPYLIRVNEAQKASKRYSPIIIEEVTD
jgi:negative regulator of sigma E activity